MPKERQARSTCILNKDVLSLIWGHAKDEASKSALARNHFYLGNSSLQHYRILGRLAQYVIEGKHERVYSLLKLRPDLLLQVLFILAGLGAQEPMEQILKQQPELLVTYAPLRDISGASFQSITLFLHAVWAGDVRYMAPMMLNCLPKNEQGEKIRIELLRQFNELMSQGVVYQLNGEMHREKQFSLKPLITELDTLVTNFNQWTPEERDLYWCTKVGHEQTRLPAHVRHHYCDPEESFWDTPSFTKEKLTRSLKFYNFVARACQFWVESLVGLASNFAMCCGAGMGRVTGRGWRALELTGLAALDKVRTETDLPALIERLHTPIQNLEDDLDAQRMKF